jgi:thiol-disulfide isomerase/thioredoxin
MSARRSPVALGLSIPSLAAVAAFMALGPVGASGAQEPGAKAAAPGAATVEGVLRKTADLYKKAKSITVEIDRAQHLGPIKMEMTTTVAFERPNRLAVRSKTTMPIPVPNVVSDGKKLSISVPLMKKYTQVDAPATLEALMGDPIAAQSLQFTMVVDLCSDDPYKTLMEGVTSSTYAGLDTLDAGAKAHHLKFTQEQFDWHMWVAADGDPLVRRVVIDLAKMIANSPQAAQLKGQKLEMTQDYKGWQLDKGIDQKSFAFEPAGAEKVDSFMQGGPPGGGDAEAPSPLLGKPAPDVSLKLLEEGKGDFKLKEHKGEHVVMLDFWATWCPPCVEELPILSKVADAYKDKGVVFCAVNQQEKPAKINTFLKDKKLNFTVALDSEGEVGNSYGASSIPLLVLIDKKGVVQSVHLGYNPGIKAVLEKELDALLAGKDLVKEHGAK